MYQLKGKNVLVTGGVGFVGGHLVEELLTIGARVVVVDIRRDKSSYIYTQKLDRKSKIVIQDLCDYDKLIQLINKYHIDFIFHLAAQAIVSAAYADPKYTLTNNIVSTINVLEAVRTHTQVKGVVVASSDKCYGKLHKKKYTEADPLAGDHPYDTSKSATDLICTTYYTTYKIPVVVTRFGNIYGEGDPNLTRIIPGIMKSLVTGKSLELRSNGTYVRDYLYVKDVVAGYLLLARHIDQAKGQAYNFGSDDNLTVLEVIKQVERILKQKVDYTILNTAVNEIPYQSLDYSKIKKKFGWKPKHSIRNTIKKIYLWYKKANHI